ncbi:hypothetical protein T261_8244 [Streptomyces lydicus]|nr:hypothetical protein T261_8244 [Streptomyces lydicus]
MLGLLDVHEGTTVLEIGTATGQLIDLLCGRCGDENVTSVEIDATLSAMAKENLARRGHAPTLVVADGEHGHPAGAPYQRLIATCALRHVPLELVQQVEADGLIVAPLIRDFWSGALVRLTVQWDGAAWGPFAGGATYMPMRSHRAMEGEPVDTSSPRSRWSSLDPGECLSLPFALYAGARLPGVSLVEGEHDGAVRVWLQDGRRSGAVADVESVTEFGPRDLWAELERVHTEFQGLGEVGVTDFGLTVSAAGQHVWLRTPGNVITPL